MWSLPWVPAAVLVMIGLRLIQLRLGGTPDEGGFLVLAGQWSSSGDSLYGNYWVDRPPLLMMLFQVADLFGGIAALRVLGIAISVATVLLLASTARRVFDDKAASVTAVVAAALLGGPLAGAASVNGELMALPFLALGLRTATEAVLTDNERTARVAALVTGAAAVSALLVKQNMVDVVVFAAVFWVFSWRQHRITWGQLAQRVGLAALGAGIAFGLVSLWAIAHGTSPADVYEATYPFRVKAARVIADNPAVAGASGQRLGLLTLSVIGSGLPLVVGIFLIRGTWRTKNLAFAWAVVALLAWATFSIVAGGSYWLHYLVEAIPAVALAAGAVLFRSPVAIGRTVRFMAVAAVLSAVVAAFIPPGSPATQVGDALGRVKHSGDTVLVTFGDPEVLRASGMSSPYAYPWSLPARTLDPKMTELREVLAGSEAPTWVVVRGPQTQARLKLGGAWSLITERYRRVGTLCERYVYLRNDVDRRVPDAGDSC